MAQNCGEIRKQKILSQIQQFNSVQLKSDREKDVSYDILIRRRCRCKHSIRVVKNLFCNEDKALLNNFDSHSDLLKLVGYPTM